MKKYSVFCFILMGVFYIIQVSVLGYTVYFLQENGYTAMEVGVLLTIFGIIAGIIQPILGDIADKNDKIDFKNILIYIGGIVIVLFVLLLHFVNNKLMEGLLFGMIFVCTNTMSPFVNASCFYYKSRGINVDFGVARGFGSFSFAIVSYILGGLIKSFGVKLVSINGIISAIVFFVIILLMPRVKNAKDIIDSENKSVIANSRTNLIKKYPAFFLMVIATILAMCFQNADGGYVIQIIENLGGDSSHLGTANAIAAISEIPIMFLMSRIMKKIKVKRLIAIACAFYIFRGFVFAIPSMTAVFVAEGLQMITYAIITPATVYLADEMMHKEDKNKGQTFIGMAVTTGLILGSFAGGELISVGGISLLKKGSIIIAMASFVFAMLGNIVR